MSSENNEVNIVKHVNDFETMEFIVNSSGAIVYVIDLNNFEILYANAKCKDEFGDVLGKPCYKVLQKDMQNACPECSSSFSCNIGDTFERENKNTLNGKTYLFSDRIIMWIDGRIAKIQVGIDASRQKELENKIAKEREDAIRSFEMLTNSTMEALIISNEDQICVSVNQAAPKLLGYEPDEMIGKSALDFIAEESYALVSGYMQIKDQEPYEAVMVRKDGSKFEAMLRGRDFEVAGNKIRVSAVMDISTIKEKEKKILELACYDPLTALPNRTLLVDRLEQLIKKSKRTQTIGALIFIDLDDFKIINDTKGHLVGDEVIKESAKRIISNIRQNDTASRLGGDEFVVLIDTMETDKSVAVKNISKVASKILSALKETYIIGDYEFKLTASMGISVFCGDEYSIQDLMKHADSAMYHAKENGRNAFNFFDPKLQKAIEEKAYMIERLRNAIKNCEIELHYQTQVDDSGFIVGVEALARWIDKELGFVSPAVFIPLAEESGLIVSLGELVIKEAVKQLKAWEQDETKRNWRVSINISSKQFERRDFTNILYSTILEHKAQPDNIRLEITESLLFKNTQEALAKINHLKELGITLSIDDFGTGYSSLSYLKQLPIDELKIDRSFIRDLTADQNDVIIVQTIISIGRKFGLEVIAEGVETKEQLEILLNMGCKNFQGYLFSKPVSSGEL